MPGTDMTEVAHEVAVAASADVIYAMIAAVETWPTVFPPTVHVEHLTRSGTSERIQLWATANDALKTWTSRRTLRPEALRVDFEQEISTPPVAAMGGSWIVEPLTPGSSRIRLLHHYRAVDDDAGAAAWIAQAVDRNSHLELAALKSTVEAVTDPADLMFSFEDSVRIKAPAVAVYDFINDAGRWAERLPHVSTVELEEATSGLQSLRMETMAPDGHVHTTRSFRVCRPSRVIAYKQVVLPALMNLHIGRWTFREDDDGVLATSRHTVVVNPDRVTEVLGPDGDVAAAKRHIRGALSTNSLVTLRHAKAHAEGNG
ncbi:aromatase/cyclase [Streptomyces sp. NPDC087294]|uniref:aromatase/cyclase n=1 Tax=Streptomyces sp. NPDC087294 TaxID=3365777 RepID=UPI00382571CC